MDSGNSKTAVANPASTDDVEARNGDPLRSVGSAYPEASGNLGTEPALAQKPVHKRRLAFLDGYAVSPAPSRFRGALITICVWLCTLAYAAFVIYQFYTQPPVTTNVIDWTIGNGPFPMTITCQAASGCFVSNSIDPNGSAGVQPAEEQRGCIFLAYKDSMTMNITSSLFPNDGLSVLYDPSTSNPELPAGGFGYTVESQVVCETFQPDVACPENGVKKRNAPASPGTNLGNMVTTYNLTVSNAGSVRMEWFLTPVDILATAPNPLTNQCVEVIQNWEASLPLLLSSGPLTSEMVSSAQPIAESTAPASGPTPAVASGPLPTTYDAASPQATQALGAPPSEAAAGYANEGQQGSGFQQGFGNAASAPETPVTDTQGQALTTAVDVGNLVQSRVLINSNFVTVTVESQTEWSSIFGVIGGSFELFLGAGAVILATSYGDGLASIFVACAASGELA